MYSVAMRHSAPRSSEKRKAVDELVRMLVHYSGLTRTEIARRLGVDRKTLRRGCADPRLSMIQALADHLDWPLQAVAEPFQISPLRSESGSFVSAYENYEASYGAGRYHDAVCFAHEMRAAADTANRVGIAYACESGAWNGLGLFRKELEATENGLAEPRLNATIRQRLLVNRANAFLELRDFEDAAALADRVVRRCRDGDETTKAFAHYVVGLSEFNLLREQSGSDDMECAETHLCVAERMHNRLSRLHPDRPWLPAIAHTCRGAIEHVRVERGSLDVTTALHALRTDLTAPVECAHRREAIGRRCVMAAQIAIDHLNGAERGRQVALFMGRARDIAEETDSWSLWERVLTLDLFRRESVAQYLGNEMEWPMDGDELRVLVGTMGRFARFRDTGWRIFRAAKLVG